MSCPSRPDQADRFGELAEQDVVGLTADGVAIADR
jgi:hypothetical protein